MKEKKYYIDTLIASGICSLIISAILFLRSRDINSSLVEFIIIFFIPCTLTLSVNAFVVASMHSEKLKQLVFRKLLAVKAVTIGLIVLLMLFQIFIISGWIMNFINRHTPMDMKLLGYFMLVGLACNIWLLYRLTEPKEYMMLNR